MPNQPDIHNQVLSLRISREFYRRLQISARQHKMGFSEYVRHLIYEATERVQLSKEDYAKIQDDIERYVERKSAARRGGKSAEVGGVVRQHGN